MALWEIALPADGAVELVLEYGGFPRDWNIAATTQGCPEISASLSVPGESEPDRPICSMCCQRGRAIPPPWSSPLPGSMTVIPFGTSEAEVVADPRQRHRHLAL